MFSRSVFRKVKTIRVTTPRKRIQREKKLREPRTRTRTRTKVSHVNTPLE